MAGMAGEILGAHRGIKMLEARQPITLKLKCFT
jgi:hypothetical protein